MRIDHALGRRVRARGQYENGKLAGLVESWYLSGVKKSETFYKDGLASQVKKWCVKGRRMSEEGDACAE